MELPSHKDLTKLTDIIATGCGVQNADRSDILQNFYCRYYSTGTYKPTYGSIKEYAAVAIKNQCRDYKVKQHREARKIRAMPKKIPNNKDYSTKTPLILAARGFVPKIHQSYFDDWIADTPIEEVAKKHNISVQAAASHIEWVINSLKKNKLAVASLRKEI